MDTKDQNVLQKKTAINTKISHGENEIGDPLIVAMAKQLFLNKNQFMELIQCTLSAESYKKILLEMGKIKQAMIAYFYY